VRILGIDPGRRKTGYAVVEKHRRGFFYVMYGEIGPDKQASLSGSLKTIYERLLEVIGETQPDCMAVEDVFYEYSPLEIKKAVVGYGRAEKSQVQSMVKAMLNLTELPPPDAADAMAVAICHANFLKVDVT
jgi:crossover junction endodeoxyribonuclease RuvC